MKKVFALLTIVTVMSFVACKNKTNDNHAADSARIAESTRQADSAEAAAKMAAEQEAAANDTANHDTAAHAPENAGH